jgi:PAS domain S-box-containing protein
MNGDPPDQGGISRPDAPDSGGDELGERETSFRYLFVENPSPMWVYDYETLKFLEVNEAAIERYGFSRAEFLTMQITEIRATEEPARSIADLRTGRRGLRPGGERRHLTKAGQFIDVETSSATIRFAGRDAVLEVSHDITERKQAEAALCESEARLKDAQRRAKLAYWSWDLAKQSYIFGDEYREIIGAESMDDLRTDEAFLRFVHEADRERVAAALQRGKETLEAQDSEYRVRRADGSIVWLHEACEPELDAAGKPIRMFGFVQDITDQKRAAEMLEESEARLRQAGRMAKFGHWVWVADSPGDWAGGRSEYSAEGAAILGRDPADLTMGTVEYCEQVVHPEERERLRMVCEQVSKDRTYTLEYRIVRPDGEARDVLEFSENTFDTDGRIVSTVGTVQDVTDRKRLEEQRLKLVHLTRVGILGQLSGVLAHELNQPLAAILSNAQAAQRLLARESPDLAETRTALGDIVEADKRATDLIDRFGALLGKGKAQFRLLDLNAVVNGALETARRDLMLRGVRTERQLTPNLPSVQGDGTQLQQVLLSLIENACEAMSTTEPPERVLSITSALGKNRTVQIGVADHGCAISPAMLERLFEPFVTTKDHALGLGLSICRSIIRAHGGHIWGVNNPDGGATFLLALPIHSDGQT